MVQLEQQTDSSKDMMKTDSYRDMKIAITGGIGSGKSFFCQILRRKGIDVYDCDSAAKKLMATDTDLQQQLRTLVGDEVYRGKTLQKAVLAKFLLASEEHKQEVNDIVHPAVARDFLNSGLSWLESAILFESGFDRRVNFDFVVVVTAPEDVRIARIIDRDNISAEKAREWIDCQMPAAEQIARADAVIINDGNADLELQTEKLLAEIKSFRNKAHSRSPRYQSEGSKD